MLASSESNIAVDNILAALVEQGVKVVRLGRPFLTSYHYYLCIVMYVYY